MESLVELLHRAEQRGELRYFLIGGRSLEAHGIVRFTKDVDFLIAATDIPAMSAELTKAGYNKQVETAIFSRWAHPSMSVDDVDLMYVRQDIFEKLLTDCVWLNFGATAVRVPSIPSLIALKLHAIRNNPERESKDGHDISELVKHSDGSMTKPILEALFAKYGCSHLLPKFSDLFP
jgi:hypothetical protein